MNLTVTRWCRQLSGWLWAYSASALLAHGNFHELITDVNAKIAAAPDQAELRLDRARIYLEHEDLVEAKADLDTALKFTPDSVRWIFLQAKWERLSKHWPEARRGVEEYLKRMPQDGAAHWERLVVLCAMDDTPEALRQADLMLGMEQNQLPELVLQRVTLAEAIDPAAALRWLDTWLAGHPRLPVWEQEALRLEMKLNQPDAALARFDQLLTKTPRKEFLLLKKARYLAELKRDAAARTTAAACLQAIEKLPEHLRFLPVAKDVTDRANELLKQLPPPQ